MLDHRPTLTKEQTRLLRTLVKPKFNHYFNMTKDVSRSIRRDNGYFLYPTETIVPDTVFLCSVFSDIYQITGGPKHLAEIVKALPRMHEWVKQIVEGGEEGGGSFWWYRDSQEHHEIPVEKAVNDHLDQVIRTLRNGFAHTHWFLANWSALEYWERMGWSTADADPDFDLAGRPACNFTIYIADASSFEREKFWDLKNLRILITNSAVLRYRLHLFCTFLLNDGCTTDVFGIEAQD